MGFLFFCASLIFSGVIVPLFIFRKSLFSKQLAKPVETKALPAPDAPLMVALYLALETGEGWVKKSGYMHFSNGLQHFCHAKTGIVFSVDMTYPYAYPPSIVSPVPYKFSDKEIEKILEIMHRNAANQIMDKLIA